MRTLVTQLRGKLGDDPQRPAWIVNEPRLGYRMPRPDRVPEGETGGGAEPTA